MGPDEESDHEDPNGSKGGTFRDRTEGRVFDPSPLVHGDSGTTGVV